MKQYEIDQMEDSTYKLNSRVESAILLTNTAITDTYNGIINSASDVNSIRNKVAVLGDMLTDLKIINGSTGNSVDLIDLDIHSVDGITIKNDILFLSKTKEQLVEINNKESLIYSTKPINFYSSNNKSKTIEEVLKYSEYTKISVEELGLTVTITLKYSRVNKINQIELILPTNTAVYPIIGDVKYLSPVTGNYMNTRFLNTNGRFIDLDENREIGNEYLFDLESFDTKEITFTLSTKEYDYLEMISLKTKYVERVKRGEMVLGPVVTDKPILKLSLSSEEASDGITLQVSPDLNTWYDLMDTNQIDTSGRAKILSFNTINDKSIKMSENITNLYIKVKLDSAELETDSNDNYENYREDISISTPIEVLEPTRLSALRIKSDDFYYGLSTYSTFADMTKSLKRDLELIDSAGSLLVRGFDDSVYSYGIKSTVINNVEIALKPLRLPALSGIDAKGFDCVGGELLDLMVIPLQGDININSETSLCFKTKLKEDNYKIVSEGRYIEYDVSQGFLRSSHSALIQVPKTEIQILNSLGVIVKTYKEEELLKIEGLETTYYFINLSDILYSLPTIPTYTFNPLYPLVDLKRDEYSLNDSSIILGKGIITQFIGHRLEETIVKKKVTVSYQNGNIWERTDPLYTYHNSQIEREDLEKTVIKLDHRSIERGSLQIFEYTETEEDKDILTLITITNKNVIPTEYLVEETNSNVFIRG